MRSPQLNHWYFELSFRSSIYWKPRKNQITLAFFKLIKEPIAGELIEREHYKGFLFRQGFNLPSLGFSFNLRK